MSNTENGLDLEKLFLPAWATEKPAAERFAHYTGEEGTRPDRRGGRKGDRRGFQEGRPPRDQQRGGDRRSDRRPEGERRSGAPGQGDPGFRRDRGERGDRREDRRPMELPLPEVEVWLAVEDKDADSLARQIRMTGRAYPVFEIAQMVLQKTERFQVGFRVIKKTDGQVAQRLFRCGLDESLWLSEDEAVNYVLERHFDTFYQAERTATQPPKGVYTFVAQCGFSGAILGPPNYHGYQEQLRKLHADRFSHLPFEVFKSRVRITKDESVVKKWIEDQSWKTEYVCLNVPESPRLDSREAVERHFRETHLSTIVQEIEEQRVPGNRALNLACQGLRRLARRAFEEQRRFPLKLVHALSQQFAARGLQFFKRDRTVIHVSVARPNYLDLETSVVSDTVRRIIEYLNAHPKSTRAQLMEALAPAPPKPAPIVGTTEPAAEASAAPAAGSAATVPPPQELTPEQMAMISDLHWLIHQGHVIEFANGIMETAKKPLPRPPKPPPAAPTPVGGAATAAGAEAATLETAVVAPHGESVSEAAPQIAEPSQVPAESPASAPSPPSPAAGESARP